MTTASARLGYDSGTIVIQGDEAPHLGAVKAHKVGRSEMFGLVISGCTTDLAQREAV